MAALRTALATPLVSLSLIAGAGGLASAADLAPKPAPVAVDYMRICSSFGPGFYFIPGTDTCLKVGGQVRTDFVAYDADSQFDPKQFFPAGTDVFNRRQQNGTAFSVRGRVDVDARTATEYGTLRSFLSIVYQRGNRSLIIDPFGAAPLADRTGAAVAGAGAGALQDLEVRRAFIQFAGFTVGRDYSFFNLPYFSTFSSPLTSDAIVTTLAYTVEQGPVSATLAIEDGTDRRGLYLSAFGDRLYAGHAMPDVVGNLTVTGSWGQFMLSGALHQIRNVSVPGFITADTRYGFAVQAGGQIYLTPGEGTARRTKLYGGVVYTDGASRYSGLGTDTDRGVNFVEFDAIYDLVDRYQQTRIISGHIGTQIFWNPAVSTSFSASYARVADSIWNEFALDGATSRDYDLFRGIANVVWEPVAGFRIGAEVVYDQVDYVREINNGVGGGVLGIRDFETWTGILRFERNF